MRAALLAASLLLVALLAPRHGLAQDVVSLGKDLHRIDPVAGSVVVVAGDAVLDTLVEKDVVVLGGNVTLGAGTEVRGDVLVVGGKLRAARGDAAAFVKGEVHTLPAVEAAFLSELETSPVGKKAAGLLVSLRLALLSLWLVAGSALLFALPRRLAAAARCASSLGAAALDALLGGVALLSGLLLAAFLLAVLPSRLALVAVAAVALLLLCAKAFGLAAVSLALGRRLGRGAARGDAFWGDPAALALGLLALGLVSLVPVAGRVVWMAVSLVAIGLAVGSAFGRASDESAWRLAAPEI